MTGNLNSNKKNPLSAPGRKPHKTKSFFHNKIFLMYFVPVISVISIIAVVLIIKAVTGKNDSLPAAAAADNVYVLPINQRAADSNITVDKDPFTSGGTAALVLDGIIYNPEGTSIIIIRSAEFSYVVSAGDVIGDTGWTATSVTADTVTIEKDGKQEVLSLAADVTAGLIKN